MHTFLFHKLHPVAFSLGPLHIHWYGMAYMFGLLLAWFYVKRLAPTYNPDINPKIFDDFISFAVMGIIIGGRLGHVLLYNFAHYRQHPFEIFMVWTGGMSFHGGLLGIMVATLLFCRKKHISFLIFADYLAISAPIGIFFGRIANFINGELYGRVTDVPWGVIFPRGGPYPRHPSQLYEAALEGLLLFCIVNVIFHLKKNRNPGEVAAFFLIAYALMRFAMEFFREIEWHFGGLTAGQILSIPMFLLGLWLLVKGKTHNERP